jgi:hypothetical protein
MKTKAISNWWGLIAIAWMMSAFVFIHYVTVPHQIVIGPFWAWIFAELLVQLIPGLVFVIVGLRCESRVGRVTAILAGVLFLWFVWYGAVPAVSVFLQASR